MSKKSVAVIGATGIVGQQAIAALENHPQFEVTALCGSERSAGKKYADAINRNGIVEWYAEGVLPECVARMTVLDSSKATGKDYDLVFSCVESDVAKELEPRFAKDCAVISTASAFRYEKDVPLIIPCVNPESAKLIDVQRKNRGWNGFIAPIPNCTTTGLAITLKPLSDAFGIKRVLMTSMQAVSGAGRSPGVKALDNIDNIIPFISGEEEKVEKETQKILGKEFGVSCTCTRAPVLEGHTESVFVETQIEATVESAIKALRNYKASVKTHSTPQEVIRVFEDPSRPQVRLDRDTGNGLTTSVGRMRKDNVFGLKYVLVSHNTKMGAAKGAVWLAEVLMQKGYF